MKFLVQSPHAWRSPRQRPHHLAARFARAGHGVAWTEPRYLRWLAEEPRRFFRARTETSPEGIRVRPVSLVNGERFGTVRRRNLAALARALNAPGPGEGPRVLWLYNPHESALADLVPHDLLVYDIMDEYRAFPWAPPRIAEEEDSLLARADWIFAGTSALFDAKSPGAPGRIECVLSGVETERFRRPAAPAPPPPAAAALRRRFRRLLGYAGAVDMRIDQPLLAAAARRRRDWGFVLLGPEAADLSLLRAEPNIVLAGPVPYEDLPGHYHSWDCALIPFVESKLTRHINPTKMLEYAAAELPVVSRALPDVRRHYANGAWLYETPEEFTAALDEILEGEGAPAERPEIRRRLGSALGWAEGRSWDALAGRMLARVEGLLAGRGAIPDGKAS